MRKSVSGFTIIEIIFVLIILGILAAVAIPKYQSIKEKAQQETAYHGVAAGLSACTMEYSSLLIEKNGDETAITYADICSRANNNVMTTNDITVSINATANGCIVVGESGPSGIAAGLWRK